MRCERSASTLGGRERSILGTGMMAFGVISSVIVRVKNTGIHRGKSWNNGPGDTQAEEKFMKSHEPVRISKLQPSG